MTFDQIVREFLVKDIKREDLEVTIKYKGQELPVSHLCFIGSKGRDRLELSFAITRKSMALESPTP